LKALYEEGNYVIEYKGEPSRRSPKKQLHIGKSRRKGKAVEYNTEGGNRIRVTALTVDTKVEAQKICKKLDFNL
jgi:hypothetical protein